MNESVWLRVETFPSKSRPGTSYTVKVHPLTGLVGCDCPAWRFKKADKARTCRHVEAVPPSIVRAVLRLGEDTPEWRIRVLELAPPAPDLVAEIPAHERAFLLEPPGDASQP